VTEHWIVFRGIFRKICFHGTALVIRLGSIRAGRMMRIAQASLQTRFHSVNQHSLEEPRRNKIGRRIQRSMSSDEIFISAFETSYRHRSTVLPLACHQISLVPPPLFTSQKHVVYDRVEGPCLGQQLKLCVPTYPLASADECQKRALSFCRPVPTLERVWSREAAFIARRMGGSDAWVKHHKRK
jgi:hypothetical protein